MQDYADAEYAARQGVITVSEDGLSKAQQALADANVKLAEAEAAEVTARAGTDIKAKVAALRAKQAARAEVEKALKTAERAEIEALEQEEAAAIAEAFKSTIAEVTKTLETVVDAWLAENSNKLKAFGATGVKATFVWDEKLSKYITERQAVADGEEEKPGLLITTKQRPLRVARDGDGGGTMRPKGSVQADYNAAMLALYPDNLTRAERVEADNELVRLKTAEAIKQDVSESKKPTVHANDQRDQVQRAARKLYDAGSDAAAVDARRDRMLAKYRELAGKA